MLLILWMMLTHSAFPHTHHEHQGHSHQQEAKEHSHHGEATEHSHHHDNHDHEEEKNLSLLDLFFQSHTHSNHSTQSISVDQVTSDQTKSTQKKLGKVLVFSNVEISYYPISEKSKRENRGIPYLKPPFLNCNLLRGPPALG